MKCAPPEGDPFSFDGPEIYRCKGIDYTFTNSTINTLTRILESTLKA